MRIWLKTKGPRGRRGFCSQVCFLSVSSLVGEQGAFSLSFQSDFFPSRSTSHRHTCSGEGGGSLTPLPPSCKTWKVRWLNVRPRGKEATARSERVLLEIGADASGVYQEGPALIVPGTPGLLRTRGCSHLARVRSRWAPGTRSSRSSRQEHAPQRVGSSGLPFPVTFHQQEGRGAQQNLEVDNCLLPGAPACFCASLGVLPEGTVSRLPRGQGLLSLAYAHSSETLRVKEHRQEKMKVKHASLCLLPPYSVGTGSWGLAFGLSECGSSQGDGGPQRSLFSNGAPLKQGMAFSRRSGVLFQRKRVNGGCLPQLVSHCAGGMMRGPQLGWRRGPERPFQELVCKEAASVLGEKFIKGNAQTHHVPLHLPAAWG